MRKRFFLGAGRWLTAIAIGFCLFRLLWARPPESRLTR